MDGETSNQTTQTQHDEQTDVESLAGTSITLGNSSITQFPLSTSETEFEFNTLEDDVRELFESQFPSTKEKAIANDKDVQDWLNTTGGEETQDVVCFDSETNQSFRDSFATEDVEKISAIILDAVKNISFSPSAWTEIEVEQEVPTGNFKSNFIRETKERPILTLMNCINLYCSETIDTSDRLQLYVDILECATRSVEELGIAVCSNERKSADMNTLKNFQEGDYFSNIRLKCIKLPQSKRPLVRAVEKFVSMDIIQAAQQNSAILFTRFTSIPDVVKKCNDNDNLNFSPDQLAKIGIFLQRAVHQEICARCLDFLKYLGFSLVPDGDDNDIEYKINLQSNESLSLSQGCSSQGSQEGDLDSLNSGNSQRSDRMGEHSRNHSQNSNIDAAIAEAEYNAMNSPGFFEFLRGHLHGDHGNSPGNSQRSWNSFESQSPPQFSIPERESAREPDFEDNEEVNPLRELEDLGYVILDTDGVPENADDSQNSDDEGPQRRRRRLE